VVAESTIDDLIFTGTGTINGVFLNVDLSGTMAISGITELAASTLDLNFKLNNLPSSGIDGRRTVQIPTFFFSDGVFTGVWPQGQPTFTGTLMVGPFDNVPTGVPLKLRMGMVISTFAFRFATATLGDSASAIGDIGSTLSFTSSGPVFTGPFTSVNSAQASLQNGLWTGTPVTAPEPRAASLAAPCTLAGIYARRRRAKLQIQSDTLSC
jgi:hypothetical protein